MSPFTLISARADLRAKLTAALEILDESKDADPHIGHSLMIDLQEKLSDADGISFQVQLRLRELACVQETKIAAARRAMAGVGRTVELPVLGVIGERA